MTITDPIVMIELPDLPPDSAGLAEQTFADLGLPVSRMMSVPFDGGTWRYFLVLRTFGRVYGCKFAISDGGPVVVIHGTDCNMVQRIHQDIRDGTQTNFQYCERRLAGGSFETIDITGKF